MPHHKLYISVTFWGEQYRRYFLDYCLASLLAPGNIPAIANPRGARLLIATPPDDWAAIQSEPTFLAAKKLIAVDHLPFDLSAIGTGHEKMLVMSRAHKLLAQRMFDDRAYGIFIYPDMIAATGFIGGLDTLAGRAVKAALCISVRFANENILAELHKRQMVTPGLPVEIAPKEMARMTIKHMHSETVRSGFENPIFDYGCASFFWVVGPGEDLLFHTANWVPALIDYGSIKTHDLSTFDTNTLDGDYLARNFSNPKDVHVIRHTADIFMISFTAESQLCYSLQKWWPYRFKKVRTTLKIIQASEFLYGQCFLDPIKRAFFSIPVRLRGGDSTDLEWQEVESSAARIVRKIEDADKRLGWRFARKLYKLLVHLAFFSRHRLNLMRQFWAGAYR